MLTIMAQEIVKFTASARPNLNHLKFTKSHIVVILQTLQERSATVKGTKEGGGRWGKHRVRAKYQGVLDDDSTYKLDRKRENCGTETFCMMQTVDAIIYTAGLIYM